ncbi:MAG: flagellar motor stator protein MotA [Candidatus Methylumidiphilus sp.]
MLIGIGYFVVLVSVFGVFALEGGHLAVLFQPLEFVMIMGCAIGAFLCGNSRKAINSTIKALPSLFKSSTYTQGLYMELMSLLYELLVDIRRDGIMSLEDDIDNPSKSAVFSKYTNVLANPHMIEFITDYLRLMLSGKMEAFQIEALMDEEIETHHDEGMVPVQCISKMGDGMPAFGIVAAVMGVVNTMGSIGKPPAELGHLIGAALVGTFLGILISYGFVGPLSSVLEQNQNESSKALNCIKVTLLASLNGYPPPIAVEFGRKVLFSTERPSCKELEEYVKRPPIKIDRAN